MMTRPGAQQIETITPSRGSMRFSVQPRDVPAHAAARRLGLTLAAFGERLPSLIARGFPEADPTTGNFDLKAVDAWMDRRSGLAGAPELRATSDPGVIAARIARMGDG